MAQNIISDKEMNIIQTVALIIIILVVSFFGLVIIDAIVMSKR